MSSNNNNIATWLNNKLGSAKETWTSGSISSSLSVQVLEKAKEAFLDLQTHVKLKLLLSFFHIPRKNLDDWRPELEGIIDLAAQDCEPWVAMLGEIMKPYPSTTSLNYEVTGPEENRRVFKNIVDELTLELKEGKDLGLLPLECAYLNPTALASLVGEQKPPTQHFTIRKKLKSERLKEELLQKAQAAAEAVAKKVPAPAVPVRIRGMPRKMTDTTPLRGFPSQIQSVPTIVNASGSRSLAGKKEGGVKFLDFTEQPLMPSISALAKRRKRQQDAEDEKNLIAGTPKKATVGPNLPKTPAKKSDEIVSPPPEYAAGLARSPEKPVNPQPIAAPLIPMTTPIGQSNTVSLALTEKASDPDPPTPKEPIVPTPESKNILVPSASTLQKQFIIPAKKVLTLQALEPSQQMIQVSKEVMEQASNMFRTSTASSLEKSHILRFMAGHRENPCPELGTILSIKLREFKVEVRQGDDSILSLAMETHFSMNYENGSWELKDMPSKVYEASGLPLQPH